MKKAKGWLAVADPPDFPQPSHRQHDLAIKRDEARMSDVMIEVENLTKDYGPTRAVDKVTFNVRKGEVLGFLGPNGAGKSTTMKMLTCFLSPTAGTAKVAGFDVFDDSLQVRRRIGYLPEDTPIYRDMTVLEYLQFAAEMRAMDPTKSPARIKEIGGRCGLGDVAGKLVGELSKGYRQRLGLAQAMLHDPDILILDEPTSGLDPNQIVEIRSLIKEIGKERTVILSTHILPEVQATCSRILIISGGKLVADGTPEALRAREKRGRYRLVIHAGGPAFRTPEASQEAIRTSLSKLAGVGGCEAVVGEDGAFTYGIDAATSDDLRPLLFKSAVDNKWTLLELIRESVSLEDVFRNLTTGDEPKHDGDQPKNPTEVRS
jgi:ABC-2 type transport system ATP-binding protein